MKLHNTGFTLIELLVAISIIAILVLGGSQINFNRLNDKSQLDVFNNKIVALFENIRNNALLGKGIGVDLDVPERWKIEFTSSGITSHYSTGTTWLAYNEDIVLPNYYEINNFNCFQIDGSDGTQDVDGESIIITGKDLYLSGSGSNSCSSPNDKILEFNTSYKKGFTNTFSINTLNGLIEID